jgi:hypothetical protein
MGLIRKCICQTFGHRYAGVTDWDDGYVSPWCLRCGHVRQFMTR